jgi:hypothetical protein
MGSEGGGWMGSVLKHILTMQILLKATPESMFRLFDFAVRTTAGFRKPLVYCELGYIRLLLVFI